MGALDQPTRGGNESRDAYRERTGIDPGPGSYRPTNWASVFRPQLASQMQPVTGQQQGPTASGTPLTGQNLQAQRDSMIAKNPLWASAAKSNMGTPSFGGISDAGSVGEDASAFASLDDGGTGAGMSRPVAMGSAPNTGNQFMPQGQSGNVQNGVMPNGGFFNRINIPSRYGGGTGFATFGRPQNTARYGAAGSTLRF